MRRIAVLDYGSGNLRSAQRALERVGAEVTVSDDPGAAERADGLVVPGVGAYAACMQGIVSVGARVAIATRVDASRPVLGICVGMQVLFDAGVEHDIETPGLGVLSGRVEALRAPIRPHMGWNTVEVPDGSTLFSGLPEDVRFYFVHSYAAHEAPGLVTRTHHGEPFVSAVEHGAVCATQFHPEKSGDAGATLLENWLGSI